MLPLFLRKGIPGEWNTRLRRKELVKTETGKKEMFMEIEESTDLICGRCFLYDIKEGRTGCHLSAAGGILLLLI